MACNNMIPGVILFVVAFGLFYLFKVFVQAEVVFEDDLPERRQRRRRRREAGQ